MGMQCQCFGVTADSGAFTNRLWLTLEVVRFFFLFLYQKMCRATAKAGAIWKQPHITNIVALEAASKLHKNMSTSSSKNCCYDQ